MRPRKASQTQTNTLMQEDWGHTEKQKLIMLKKLRCNNDKKTHTQHQEWFKREIHRKKMPEQGEMIFRLPHSNQVILDTSKLAHTVPNLLPPFRSDLPETSFSCSMKSLPVISANEFGSMFDSSSKSSSLSTATLYRLFFSWPTISFRCTRSTSAESVASQSEWRRVVIVT